MKIGLLNFQYSNHNYGAVLQAAALEYYLNDIGDVEHIDFIPKTINRNTLRPYARRLAIAILKTFKLLRSNRRNFIGNSSAFERFRSSWLTRTVEKYQSLDELYSLEDKYDVIIVGSDQVWRLAYTMQTGMVHFLPFAGANTRKVSYAASFGRDTWESNKESDLTLKVKSLLSNFHSVSVREDSGVAICAEIFDLNSTHVLDPTLLVGKGFFDSIADTAPKQKYYSAIVYYKLDVDDEFINQISLSAEILNVSSENIYYSIQNKFPIYNEVNAWLDKIRNADLVITDSYHCICFAIIFRKKFIYSVNLNRGISRLESLLGSLGLSDTICSNITAISSDANLGRVFEYGEIEKLLDIQRESSKKFITESLKE